MSLRRLGRVAGIALLPFLMAPAGVRAQQADSVSTDATHHVIRLLLGYSFGYASFDSPQPPGSVLDKSDSGNEPLLAVVTELNRDGALGMDVRLALASFGHVINVAGEQDSDVRRSVLADGVLRWRPSARHPSFFLSANGGFVFDAQDDSQGTGVTDAKSYLMVGPQVRTPVGKSEIGIDLFLGASEVMTGEEIPDWHLGQDDLRIRPRLTFNLVGGAKAESEKSFLVPLTVGLWGDLGFSDKDNDTFVVFIARPIWSTDPESVGS